MRTDATASAGNDAATLFEHHMDVLLGLADRVVPEAGLLDAVEAYVEDMARTVSPTALATMKAQVHRHLWTSFDEAAVESDDLMGAALKHPDATEGAMSFIERRPPRFAAWTGSE